MAVPRPNLAGDAARLQAARAPLHAGQAARAHRPVPPRHHPLRRRHALAAPYPHGRRALPQR
eukprot:3916778-Prymnesium_polylepis.1